MKKSQILFIIIIVCVIVIAGVFFTLRSKDKGIKTADKDTIDVSIASQINALDPALSLTVDIRSILSNMYEGLFNIDDKGNITPGVATEYYSNDEKTIYTFKLREDAKWSDGMPVTAQNFKDGWTRVLNPETASAWSSYLYYIKNAEAYNKGEASAEDLGIEVKDDFTLIVTMEEPCLFFAEMTTIQPYYPVRLDKINEDNQNWDKNSSTQISNGAFRLKEWNNDVDIQLVKNENYWNNQEIKIKNINFLLYSDVTLIQNAYETGTLDFVEYTLTNDEMKQLDEIKFADYPNIRILEFNLDKDIFKDIRVREAINLALNRKEIASFMGEGNNPLLAYIPPNAFKNTYENKDFRADSLAKDYYSEEANIEKAKQLLKEAGYENGEGLPTINYLTNTIGYNVKTAEIVKNQLSKIGVNVQINSLDRNIMQTTRSNGEYDLTTETFLSEFPDISSYLYSFVSNDFSNYAHFNSSEYDEIYAKIISTSDQKEKFELAHKAEEIVLTNQVVVPLYYLKLSYISNDNLKGYIHDVTGCLNFKGAYYE